MLPRDTISAAINAARAKGQPAIVAFMTGGFPDRISFAKHLHAVADAADVVEIGVPFTDPMADGTTIQRSSRAALAAGTTLKWILAELGAQTPKPKAPILLMSYLNPLLAFGLDELPQAAAKAGVSGFIIPDLPFEESADMRAALEPVGLALVQLVTPVTPPERLAMLCKASQGFVYAVTVKAVSPLPVCAGFGIRSRKQVERMGPAVDGVVVGSALVEVLERGADPAAFLRGLKAS